MEREEERGGEENGREAVRAGAAGSQKASRSGLLSRGTGGMSPPDVDHVPRDPEESKEERRGSGRKVRRRRGGAGS